MRKTLLLLLLTSSLAWSDTLIMKDGSRHHGVLETTTEQYVTFNENGMRHRYQRSDVQSIEFNSEGQSTAYDNHSGPNYEGTGAPNDDRNYSDTSNNRDGYANNRPYNGPMNGHDTVTLTEGTDISVMTDANIDSQSANEGQLFPAEVAQDVVDSAGNVVIPKGSQAELAIRSVSTSGTATETNDLALGLDSVRVGNNTYRVSTEDVEQQSNAGIGKNKRTGEYVGGGAVLGTLIGAIAGGGKGAAIGAIAGAGAGAGAQVLTRGKAVKVPAETTLHFRLDQPLHLRPE